MASTSKRTRKAKAAPKNAMTPKPAVTSRTVLVSKATSPRKAVVRASTAPARPRKRNPAPQAASGPALSAQERERLIARAAYFRSEKRGFAPGCELQDWVEAEAEMLRLIGKP